MQTFRACVHLGQVVLGLGAAALTFVGAALRSRTALAAENLFLRKQLALYRERQVKPRRVSAPLRLALVLLARCFAWREALMVVQPATLLRWHREGFRLLWRWRSRPGRPRLPADLQRLIGAMAKGNPTWGEERIAAELLLKLGMRVSPRTVRCYMARGPGGRGRGVSGQRWAAFVRNHAQAVVALRGGDRHLPGPVRLCGARGWQPTARARPWHQPPDGGLDPAAVSGSPRGGALLPIRPS